MKFLDKDEVEYLSFEGGGGKGNAYLGAIQAFENLDILKYNEGVLDGNIKGISGSSAGAITALMIGSGYTFQEIKEIFQKQDFNDFFDLPNLGLEIKVGYFGKINKLKEKYDTQNPDDILQQQLKGKSFNSIVCFIINKIIRSKIFPFIREEIKKQNKKLEEKLFDEDRFENYLKGLYVDFGLFTGEKIHRFFNKLIVDKIHKKNPILRNYPEKSANRWIVNFAEFREHFKVDLKFTSVNMRTGSLHILSESTTPNLPVATAARMSMSLPFVFKPVIIDDGFSIIKNKKNDYFNGLWVDGGLFDNAPVRIFESDKCLLIRLGPREGNANLENFLSYFGAYLVLTAGGGSGTGQITQSNWSGFSTNIIELDVSGLSLLQFNPEPTILEKLIVENRKRVLNYFNPIYVLGK